MKLTKKQIDIMLKIEHLLENKLEYSAINRKTIKVKIDDHRFSNKSDLYVKIARICKKYNFGIVEPNGINFIAIIVQ